MVDAGEAVEGEVLTMRFKPGTPGTLEGSLATRVFTLEVGKKYGTTHLVHVHRGINGTVLRDHDRASELRYETTILKLYTEF